MAKEDCNDTIGGQEVFKATICPPWLSHQKNDQERRFVVGRRHGCSREAPVMNSQYVKVLYEVCVMYCIYMECYCYVEMQAEKLAECITN